MKIIKIIGVVLCATILAWSFQAFNSQNALDATKNIEIDQFLEDQYFSSNPKLAKTKVLNEGLKVYPSKDKLSYLETKLDDSPMFGDSLAVGDKYLAIGDRLANRVVIYLRQADNSWLRSYEINPPKPLIGKVREFSFGSDLELNRDMLIVHSSVYEGFWGNYRKKKTVKRQVHLVSLGSKQAKRLQKINLFGKDLYYNGTKFLGDNIALIVREKSSSGNINNHIYLIDPKSGKRIKDIKLPDLGYKDTGLHSLGIDSDGENLVILLLRRYSLQSKPPLLITKDGNVSQIKLKRQDIDSMYPWKNEPSVNSVAMEITNKLLVIRVDRPFFYPDLTAFWQRFPQPEWIDAITASGTMEGKDNSILMSYARHQRLLDNTKPDYTFLTFLPDNRSFAQSNIEWSCAVKSGESDKASTQGLIDNDNLILSAYGTVAIVPTSNLASSQKLSNPNCRSN